MRIYYKSWSELSSLRTTNFKKWNEQELVYSFFFSKSELQTQSPSMYVTPAESWIYIETIYENRVNFIYWNLSSFNVHARLFLSNSKVYSTKPNFSENGNWNDFTEKFKLWHFHDLLKDSFYHVFLYSIFKLRVESKLCMYLQKEIKVLLYYCLVSVSNAVSNSIFGKRFPVALTLRGEYFCACNFLMSLRSFSNYYGKLCALCVGHISRILNAMIKLQFLLLLFTHLFAIVLAFIIYLFIF